MYKKISIKLTLILKTKEQPAEAFKGVKAKVAWGQQAEHIAEALCLHPCSINRIVYPRHVTYFFR